MRTPAWVGSEIKGPGRSFPDGTLDGAILSSNDEYDKLQEILAHDIQHPSC